MNISNITIPLHIEKKKNNNLPLDDFFDESQIKRGQSVYNFFQSKINFRKGNMLDHGCAVGLTMLAWKNKGWGNHWN